MFDFVRTQIVPYIRMPSKHICFNSEIWFPFMSSWASAKDPCGIKRGKILRHFAPQNDVGEGVAVFWRIGASFIKCNALHSVTRTPTKQWFCCGGRALFALARTQQNKNFVALVVEVWYNSIVKCEIDGAIALDSYSYRRSFRICNTALGKKD